MGNFDHRSILVNSGTIVHWFKNTSCEQQQQMFCYKSGIPQKLAPMVGGGTAQTPA